MVSGVEEVSPGGGSRGSRRVVISRSFLRCRRVRGSSRGGSTPPPLLLLLVLALLPGLGWPDPGVCLFWVCLFWVGQQGLAFSCRPVVVPAAGGGLAHAGTVGRVGLRPEAARPVGRWPVGWWVAGRRSAARSGPGSRRHCRRSVAAGWWPGGTPASPLR